MALTGSREDEKRAAEALARQAASGVAEVQSLASESLVRAPRQGEVTRVVLHEGEVTPAGFPLVTLLDHSDKWVVFNIREDELANIKVGTELKAKVPTMSPLPFIGSIRGPTTPPGVPPVSRRATTCAPSKFARDRLSRCAICVPA